LKEEELFELKVLFLGELATGYREARKAQERLLRKPGDRKAVEALRGFFHRVAGPAQSIELTVLGCLASVAERAATVLLQGKGDQHETAQMFADALAGVSWVLDHHGAAGAERPLRESESSSGALGDALAEGRELSKVLVIDDDAFSAGLIDSTLRGAGFVSSFCCDPRQAMDKISEELPDLIILDVMMPELDGFELCRRVRNHPAMQFTPIVFVTRKGDVEQRIRGLEVGGNDYIAKPFEPRELIARVRSHLLRLATLREMAVRDGLTRCFNHKYFKTRLEQEIARARRYGLELSVFMLDADHFKRVNDQHGHAAGDVVLAHLANVIAACVRGTDIVARYGGEEFGLILIQAGRAESEIIADRMRDRVGRHPFMVPDAAGTPLAVPVTVSIGVAQYAKTDSLATLLQRADSALYAAKNAGRNRVMFAAPPSIAPPPAS
jgi:diguanylate cyclase (GGDEF)-like protein